MPKPLKDLSLGDGVLIGGRDLLVQRRTVEIFVAEIEELLEDPAFRFASDTLEGIRETVRLRQQVSQPQREAVENIRAGGERHETQRQGWERHERRTGRRYEGWEPSR